MEIHSHAEFDCENGFEDDIFYAELKRQILQLTADDGEAVQETKGFSSAPLGNQDPRNYSTALPSCNGNFNCWGGQNIDKAPAWLEKLWRRGHGTGVFIPQTIQSKRHYPARMNRGNKRIYKEASGQFSRRIEDNRSLILQKQNNGSNELYIAEW